MQASDQLQHGVQVGRYLLQSRLATGGMADVWLATATGVSGFQKTVVLKTILPHLAQNPEFVRMFINEALLAAALDHPNIVHIFDLGQFDDAYFIAMEYISGRTLRQIQRELRRSKRRVPPPWFALSVAASVCDALDYAHNKKDDAGKPLGLVHRDVTPENIMVSFSGETKVLDFGIAKANSAAMSTQVGTLKGKFAYMAPEQITGAGQGLGANPQFDVYAVGVVLYEILTGKRPYGAPNELALLRQILEAEPPAPTALASWIPKPLESLILRAMNRDPRSRFQSAAEMRGAIEEYMASRNMHPTPRHVGEYVTGLFSQEQKEASTAASGSAASSGQRAPTSLSAGLRTATSEASDSKGPRSVEVSVELAPDSVDALFDEPPKPAGASAEDPTVLKRTDSGAATKTPAPPTSASSAPLGPGPVVPGAPAKVAAGPPAPAKPQPDQVKRPGGRGANISLVPPLPPALTGSSMTPPLPPPPRAATAASSAPVARSKSATAGTPTSAVAASKVAGATPASAPKSAGLGAAVPAAVPKAAGAEAPAASTPAGAKPSVAKERAPAAAPPATGTSSTLVSATAPPPSPAPAPPLAAQAVTPTPAPSVATPVPLLKPATTGQTGAVPIALATPVSSGVSVGALLPKPTTSGRADATPIALATPVSSGVSAGSLLPKPTTGGRPDASVLPPSSPLSGPLSAGSLLPKPTTTGRAATPAVPLPTSATGGAVPSSTTPAVTARADSSDAAPSSRSSTSSRAEPAARSASPESTHDGPTDGGGESRARGSHAWDVVMKRARLEREAEIERTSGQPGEHVFEEGRTAGSAHDGGDAPASSSAQSADADSVAGSREGSAWDRLVEQARRTATAAADSEQEVETDETSSERDPRDPWLARRRTRGADRAREPDADPWTRREHVSPEVQALRLFDQGLERMKAGDYVGAREAWLQAADHDPTNRMIQGNLRTLKKLMKDGGE